MRERHLRFCLTALMLCAGLAAPARAYVDKDRWNSTATNGATGPKGTPVTVTWSFAPDGTSIPSASSNLISFLDLNFGAGQGGPDYTQRPWFAPISQAFNRLGQVAGITYVYEPQDDKASFASLNRGVLGVRGDVRLGGKSYGPGDLTLASNFFPDYAEMMINTDQGGFLANPTNDYRPLRNTLMHELMHGLGLDHVDSLDSRFLLEPTLGTSFDGPQLDDILGLQRLYGDVFEKNGGNDSTLSPTPLGPLSAGQSLVRGTLGDSTSVAGTAVDFMSIDDDSDVDFFRFTLSAPLSVTLNLTPKGATYMVAATGKPQASFNSKSLSNLSLALFDASGAQIGQIANANGAGLGESITHELDAGAYIARVTGAHDDVQLYELSIGGTALAPDHLDWVGGFSGSWNVASTPDFFNGTGADVFHNADHVTFGDVVAMTNVTVEEAVAPTTMTVAAASDYTFSGAGIATNLLTVSGGGTLTLANEANALGGINVLEGALQITGSNNLPLVGSVHVAAGAVLELAAPVAFGATSHLSGGGQVIGNVTSPGIITPGNSVGTLTFADDLTLTGASVLAVEVGGTAAGSQHDVVSILGDATLSGELEVTLVNGYQPAAGASFSILTVQGTRLGAFAALSLPELGNGLLWHASYLAHEVILSVSAATVYAAADFNEDGFVDGDDLDIWRSGLGITTGATRAQGDANGDFAVDGRDFMIWQRGLNHAGPLGSLTPPVPEPAGIALSIVALVGCSAMRPTQRRTA